MKLYLISQTENNGYDTFDSAVVAAPSEDAARKISPSGSLWDEKLQSFIESSGSWARYIKNVKVEYIGEAAPGTKSGVICSSFNAG